MVFPLASSSTSLSMYRMFCISGSSMSWTRCPQMLPVMRQRDGFRCGACSKNSSRVTFSSRTRSSPSTEYPVSQVMTSWSSLTVLPLRSTFLM